MLAPQPLRTHSTYTNHPIPTFCAHSNINNLVGSPQGHSSLENQGWPQTPVKTGPGWQNKSRPTPVFP